MPAFKIDLEIAAEDAGKGEEGHYKLLRQIGGFEPHRSRQKFTSEIRYLPPSLDGFAGGIMSRNCLFFGVLRHTCQVPAHDLAHGTRLCEFL